MIVLRNAILLLAGLLLAACATQASLKISEVRECLAVGANVNAVASCIKPAFGYQMKRSEGLPIHWLKDFCPDANYKNCSHSDLLERVNTGASHITIQPGDKKHSEVEIVRDPYVLFYSDAQNLGGSLVMLYVFYKEIDGKVIGWINLGSALNKLDFRAARN